MSNAQIRTFKDLVVWQKAVHLTLEVYRLSHSFPAEERYAMILELRKTARSVPYNIAEGYRRRSRREYLRFLVIASGSEGELETQLLLARELGYLNQRDAEHVLALHAEVGRMLDALIRRLRERKDQGLCP